ncbi:MAG: 5,10-methylenetetrahydromethanopterin reductase [Acidimicrobiales bacterium]|jgi:5,10-methylenetetrahydromethanopterin reductase
MSENETAGPRVGLALWGTEPVQAMVGYAQLAERVGFESIWLVDTQLICRELYVTLAACAVATEHLRLASGVTVPRTRHASVTASGLATLHELSAGRALAGISTGHSALRNIGEKPAPISELAEYVAAMRQLLDGGTVRFASGSEGALTWMPEPASVPLHVAASGPRLTKAAAGMADGVILLQGAAPDLIDDALGLVSRGLADAGRSETAVEKTVWVYVGLDNDQERAYDQVRARVAAIVRLLDPARLVGEDREIAEQVRREYDMFAHADSMPKHAALIPERLLDRYAIAGTPDEVRGRISELATDERIDRIVVSPQIGAPGQPITGDFIAAFGEAVLAHL